MARYFRRIFVLITVAFILASFLLNMRVGKRNLTGYKPLHGRGLAEDPCNVTCKTGTPCEYRDEVDFRIIVITYDRPESLKKCLEKLHSVEINGDDIVVDIWIDRSKKGAINNNTLNVALEFQSRFKFGRVCIHKQQQNAYIMGQWIDTWRPKENTKEIALILEDDIDISPLAYRWLKAAHRHFGNWTEIAGYTLQMANVKFVTNMRWASGPASQSIFLYNFFGPWGFAPHPQFWRQFQDWFHETRKNHSFHPYMPGTVINKWYLIFKKRGTQDSMWSMWFIYFIHIKSAYSVYPNLLAYTGREDVLLDTNRREVGLHFRKGQRQDNSHLLLTHWNQSFVNFPAKEHATWYDIGGQKINVT